VTRSPWAVLAAVAVLLVAGLAQAAAFARPVPAVVAEPELAREVSCQALRLRFTQELSVWKGGVKDGHDQQVEANLAVMRLVLRRLQVLSEQGACGG